MTKKRTRAVTVRLSPDEMQTLDNLRGRTTRGRYVRTLLLSGGTTLQVPSINQAWYSETRNLGNNLNQLVRLLHLNPALAAEAGQIRELLHDLRCHLIGADVGGGEDQ